MIGDPDSKYLVASDAGYGFIATLSDLISRNKAGKSILRVPPGGRAVVPAPVPADCECLIAAVTSIGKLLVFEAEDLPELAKGKGNKIIGIPTKIYKEGAEKLVAVSGVRRMTIKWDDLDDYYYERGRRGNLLPQGWRKVERLAAEQESQS
jgi:topoisomerase-4 subunit A